MTKRNYHTLFIREDGRWCPQFGDYERSVVAQEQRDEYPGLKKSEWKIVTHEDSLAGHNAAVAELNANG